MSYGMPTLVVGNLTADPELKFSQNGKPYVRLTIANTPRVKDRDTNQWSDGPASFIGVTLYDDYATNAAASVTKGTRVVAYGELEKRVWQDSNGLDRESLQLENVTTFAVDLRFAQANVQRAAKGGQQQAPAQQQGGQQYGPPQGGQYGPPQGQQYAPPQGPPQQYGPPQGAPSAQGQWPSQGGPGPQQFAPPQQPQQGYPAPAGQPQQPPAQQGAAPGYQYPDETPF
jgi:single-strand DNA-binding protein